MSTSNPPLASRSPHSCPHSDQLYMKHCQLFGQQLLIAVKSACGQLCRNTCFPVSVRAWKKCHQTWAGFYGLLDFLTELQLSGDLCFFSHEICTNLFSPPLGPNIAQELDKLSVFPHHCCRIYHHFGSFRSLPRANKSRSKNSKRKRNNKHWKPLQSTK